MNDHIVFIIEIPKEVSGVEEFTGVSGGVDYYKGRGSTSGIHDARLAQDRGCTIWDQAGKRLYIARSFDRGLREPYTAHDAPVEDILRPVEPPPLYVNRKDREQRERAKRLFAGKS